MTSVREKQPLLSLLPLFITSHNPDTACDYLSRHSLLGQQHSNAEYTIADQFPAHFRLYDHLELYNFFFFYGIKSKFPLLAIWPKCLEIP